MSEMGKSAKRMGHVNPNDLRRSPAMPDRPTPAKGSHKPARAQFGVSYQYELKWCKKSRTNVYYKWFRTATARDQSLASMIRHNEKFTFYKNIKPVERSTIDAAVKQDPVASTGK